MPASRPVRFEIRSPSDEDTRGATGLDTRELRACLGRFATGVTIVTFASDRGPRGITVNAFTSVSLDPPLILISIAERAQSHDLLRDRPFAVNVLRTEQEFLARHFAGVPEEGVSVPWIEGKVAPRLDGTLAWLECAPWRAHEAGDHTLYLGEVVVFEHHPGDALGYFAGAFFPIPEPAPSAPSFPYDPFELPYDAID